MFSVPYAGAEACVDNKFCTHGPAEKKGRKRSTWQRDVTIKENETVPRGRKTFVAMKKHDSDEKHRGTISKGGKKVWRWRDKEGANRTVRAEREVQYLCRQVVVSS